MSLMWTEKLVWFFLFRDEFHNEILEIHTLSFFLFLLIWFLQGNWEKWRKSTISKKESSAQPTQQKAQSVFLTSQLISISCGKWLSILIFSGFLSGAGEKKEYGFSWHWFWKQCRLKRHLRQERFTSGINYVQGLTGFRSLKALIKKVEWTKRRCLRPAGGVL